MTRKPLAFLLFFAAVLGLWGFGFSHAQTSVSSLSTAAVSDLRMVRLEFEDKTAIVRWFLSKEAGTYIKAQIELRNSFPKFRQDFEARESGPVSSVVICRATIGEKTWWSQIGLGRDRYADAAREVRFDNCRSFTPAEFRREVP